MSNEIKAAEKRAYSKGYYAGQRRLEAESGRRDREAKREAFRREVFLAALNGTLIAGGWQTDGKKWSDAESYSKGCWVIANKALKGTWF